jgi:hypothetical protein
MRGVHGVPRHSEQRRSSSFPGVAGLVPVIGAGSPSEQVEARDPNSVGVRGDLPVESDACPFGFGSGATRSRASSTDPRQATEIPLWDLATFTLGHEEHLHDVIAGYGTDVDVIRMVVVAKPAGGSLAGSSTVSRRSRRVTKSTC